LQIADFNHRRKISDRARFSSIGFSWDYADNKLMS
jgi:hypothetical protein